MRSFTRRLPALWLASSLGLLWPATLAAQEPPAPAEPVSAAAPAAASQPAAAPAPATGAVLRTVALRDGRTLRGEVLEQRPGRYLLLRLEGHPEPYAVVWSQIASVDGAPPAEVPAPGPGSLIPEGFRPTELVPLARAGKRASELLPTLLAPKDGTQLIGSIQGAQDVLEAVGLKRGPPNAFMVAYPLVMLPLCFEVNRGNFGRIDGTGFFGSLCSYVITPISVAMLIAAPFVTGKQSEHKKATVHHIDISVYALDYQKTSALTGALRRQPSGSFIGNNLGYDLAYTYIHPRYGIIGYGHGTLQQTSIGRGEYVQLSNEFLKVDAQVGLDFVRLLSRGDEQSYWSQHKAYFRGGPSLFHNWILTRDHSGNGASVDNPLNRSMGLATGFGYELAAELDFRFPSIKGFSTGGVHFQVERGSYPALAFPELNASDGALVAMIGFDDLKQGDSYTWQRLKLDLELPLNFSRKGAVYLGGQLAKYENNFGSGVNNRGISLDYRLRY